MTISLSTPVTGSAQTGLTAPTYTIVPDTAPEINAKQWAVTSLGGTQVGVDVHTVASPFTIAFFRPRALKALSAVDPVTGALRGVPRNEYKVVTRKGAIPLAGQPAVPMLVRTSIEVPAGADFANPEDVRACLSFHIGSLTQVSAGLGDTCVNGVL